MARGRDIITRFLGDEKDLLRASKKVEQATGGVAKGFAAAKSAVQGMIGLAVVRVLAGWAKAAMEDAEQQAVLANVITSTTGATKAQISAVEDWITATQRQTGVADSELRPALADLLTFGMSVADAQRNMAIAMDIATAKGIPLAAVVRAIGKASNGTVGALGKMGVAVRDETGGMLTFDEAMANAAATMGGSLAASIATSAGQARVAKAAYDELTESIGMKLMPAVGAVAADLLELSDAMGPMSKEAASMRETLTLLALDGVDVLTNKTYAAMRAIELTGINLDQLGGQLDLLGGDLQLSASDWDDLAEAVAAGTVDLGLSVEELAALNRELANRTGLAQYAEATRILADATRDSTDAVDARIRSQLGLNDAILAAVNPTLAVLSATNSATDAAKKYQDAVIEFGPDSEEVERATIDLAEAVARLSAANATFAEEGGQQGVDALEEMLRSAGVAEDAIRRLISVISGLNSTPIMVKNLAGGTIKSFHTGGTVPGPVGAEQLAVVRGGETVTPARGPGVTPAGVVGRSVVINMYGATDAEQTARTVARHLRRLDREAI